MKKSEIIMKIVWLIRNLLSYHHARLEEFAARSGMEILLLQITDQNETGLAYVPENPSYEWDTLFPGVPATRVGFSMIADKLRELLGPRKVDVAAICGYGMAPGVAMLEFALERRIPVVIFSETNYFDHPRKILPELLKRQFVRNCTAAVASGTNAAEYLRSLGMSDAAVQVGYSAVGTAHFRSNREHRPENPYFLSCSRFIPKKNLLRLIDAYAIYRRTVPAPWPLKIAGDGELRPVIEAAIAEKGLGDAVQLLGVLNYDELVPCYREAGAFLLLSTLEQWGLVVNEAMAAGCPVIVSSRCGCARDLVCDGENGFVIDPFSVEDIAEKMCRIGRLSPDELTAMGRRSTEIVENWGVERFANGLRAAAEYAVATYRRPGWLPRLCIWLDACRRRCQSRNSGEPEL